MSQFPRVDKETWAEPDNAQYTEHTGGMIPTSVISTLVI